MTESNGHVEPRRFTLKRKEIPLELEGADGTLETFIMRELAGIQRDAWLNKMKKKGEISTGGAIKVTDFTNLQADLLCMCIYDSSDKLVDLKTIQQWPASLQTELFDLAQDLSGLKARAAEEAKNA
jgi:hypothetical protein